MKKNHFIILMALLPLMACANADYDISEGFNKDLTLFGEEISVPVGSIGPLTINLALGSLGKIEGIGTLVGQYIKVADDGSLYMDNSGSIFQINAYELEKSLPNPAVAQTWDAGYQYGYIGGMASMLGYVGLKSVNQKVVLSISNPFRFDIPVASTATYSCSGGETPYTASIDELKSFTMEARAVKDLMTIVVPADVTSAVSNITLSTLKMTLPAHPASEISDMTGNLLLALKYYYTSGIAVGEKFAIPIKNMAPAGISLPIGKFKLKKCEVSLEIESTLPIQVSVSNVHALKPKESEDAKAEIDENISIDADCTIDGGSPEHPSITTLKLAIEALDGTIPDIAGVQFDLNLAAQPGLGAVPLSSKQGVYVKSSTARVSGGITIPIE